MSHGITARRHPVYKQVAKAAGELHMLKEARTDAVYAFLMSDEQVARRAGLDVRSAEYKEVSAAIMAEATEKFPYPQPSPDILDLAKEAERSGLYRRSGIDLSVRYDKVGKAAWVREFERLGKPLPPELTWQPTPSRRPW